MPLPIRSTAGLLVAALFAAVPCAAAPTVVFSTNFDTSVPSQVSAPGAVLDFVQGYAGLGPAGRQFGGKFLHYTSVPVLPTVLTLRGLPAHDHLSVKFLLGVIDSWDGTELMQISVAGTLEFNHWFQLATGDTTNYFPAPPGAILKMGTDLGFSGCCYYNRDRAYDLGAEPAFIDIPHTADSVVVVWTLGALSGPAASQWQGGTDESWAIDALSVEVSTLNTDVPGAGAGRLAVAAAPNPVRGGTVRLTLSLADAGPARIELIDLAGRIVASGRVEAGAPGSREMTLTSERGLPNGLYFARVVQGGNRTAARVIVVD